MHDFVGNMHAVNPRGLTAPACRIPPKGLQLLLVWFLVIVQAPLPAADTPKPPTLTLTTLKWPGLADPALPHQGYIPHVAEEALKRAGFTPRIEIVPWARAVKNVKSGRADGFVSVFVIWQPDFPTVVIEPFYAANIHFAKHRDSEVEFNSLKDLQGLRVAQLRGSWYHSEFESDSAIEKEYVTNLQNGLRMLARRRVDLFVEPEHPLIYAIQSLPPAERDAISILPTPLTRHQMGMRLGPHMVNQTETIRRLNQVFKTMKTDGSLERLKEMHQLADVADIVAVQ